MTVSEKIFDLIEERKISQKTFSQLTGIAQSSISDWKRKKTNPSSDKILIICDVLQVTPYELLSGTDTKDNKRSNPSEMLIVEKNSELGRFLIEYQALDENKQGRVMGYLKALQEL